MRFAPSVGKEKEGDSGEEGEDEATRIARKKEKALRKKNKRAQKYVLCVCVCVYMGVVVRVVFA